MGGKGDEEVKGGKEEEGVDSIVIEEGERDANVNVFEGPDGKVNVMDEPDAKLNEVDEPVEGTRNGEGNAVGDESHKENEMEIVDLGDEDDLEEEGGKKDEKVVRFRKSWSGGKRGRREAEPYITLPKRRKLNKVKAYDPFRKMNPALMTRLDKFLASCEDSERVKLFAEEIPASILKGIANGESLADNVLNNAFCEVVADA